MIKKISLLFLLVLLFGSVACAAPEETESNDAVAAVANTADTAVSTTSNSTSTTATTSEAATNETQPMRLNEDYEDALSVMTQLAIGTIQLEETALAVDEAMAAALLPLWQAAQSLSNSETTAAVEMTAVLNQIQDGMNPEQVAAIANMALTEESLTALLESGAITFGRGAGGRGQNGEGGTGTPPAGFIPGQGGGPGSGGAAAGGLGGPGGGNLSEDDIATRQAQIASGEGVAEIQEQALVGAVVRLLQMKSGDVAPNPGMVADRVYAAVSEATGLSVEYLQVQASEGMTLVALIEANGGDVTAVRAAIITDLNGLQNADSLDIEQIADSWLRE